MGYMDELVGTYFEKESRRFLNTRYENPIYGWQIIERQQHINTQPNLRIKEIEDNTVVLEIASGVKIKIDRNSIFANAASNQQQAK